MANVDTQKNYITDYIEDINRTTINSKKIVEVEGGVSTLDEFIRINIDDDVEPISDLEIMILEKMEIGQSVNVGICEVKRLKQ